METVETMKMKKIYAALQTSNSVGKYLAEKNKAGYAAFKYRETIIRSVEGPKLKRPPPLQPTLLPIFLYIG